ncbi:glycosyltransferase family 2 protein [Desulfogranum mediterraneum]|uniref:glycosyltransferase family 2 protein n=1 Tax=Desulfogranum mediterraneum TaxID=160661 RepID=UPI000426BAF6|nr:glycosyltransferase family 2 protein [Desulfogranum mediterraneum]
MRCPSLQDIPAPPAGRTGWPWTEASDSSAWLRKRVDWPRVSIVMPSYNQAEFIEESIRSVLLQGYPDLEFLVYDAESSDGSVNIIRKYEPWLTFWVSEKDRGQSDAINKGLRKSTGKYFNWQNSDDILTPCCLFKAVNALLEHPEASLVHGYEDVIYADGSLHATTENAFGPPTRLAPDVGRSIATLKTGTQPGCLMDRDLVLQVGGLNEDLHFVMDIDLLLRLAILKPALYLHEKLVYYRYHSATKSHNEWPETRALERLSIARNLYAMPEAQPYQSLRRDAMAQGHRYAADCFWMNGSPGKAIKHTLLDIAWSPFKHWDQRRGTAYKLKQRKISQRKMLAAQNTEF